MSEEFHYGDAVACLGDPDTWTDPISQRLIIDWGLPAPQRTDSAHASNLIKALTLSEHDWRTALWRLTRHPRPADLPVIVFAGGLFNLHQAGLPVDTIAALRACASLDHNVAPRVPLDLAAVAVVAGLTPAEAIEGVYRHRGAGLADWTFLAELTRPGIMNALIHEHGLGVTVGPRGA